MVTEPGSDALMKSATERPHDRYAWTLLPGISPHDRLGIEIDHHHFLLSCDTYSRRPSLSAVR